MRNNTRQIRIVSPGEFMQMKRQVLVWTVITKDMREHGYKSIEPQFTAPSHLSDDDICHVQAVILPLRFDFGDSIIQDSLIYDYEHDQAPVGVTVNHDETMMNLQIVYENDGESHIDTYNYPLVEAKLTLK